jgi:prevent-host-death family protein
MVTYPAKLEPPGAERPRVGEPPRLYPDKALPLSTAKGWLSQLVTEAEQKGRRFIITKRGKFVAAIICARDLERLELFEQAAQVELFPDSPDAGPVPPPYIHGKTNKA